MIEPSEKSRYLHEIFTQFGDFELWYVKGYDPEAKKVVPGWPSWKVFSKCSEKEIEEANLRSVMKQEIVLDIEDPAMFEPIVDELTQIPVTFLGFKTGSRGYHIHMVFDELAGMEPNKVTLIKDGIIKHFNCDISKKSERNLIALEYEKHFKTGNTKEMVASQSRGKNNLNLFLAMTIRLSELKNKDPKFFDLYSRGAWETWGFPSRSEAEMSLCSILAYEGFAFDEIKQIMEYSKIGKWQEKPDSYKEMTISKAIQNASIRPKMEQKLFDEPLFKFFEEYGIPEPISWLIPRYIPYKGVTIFTGKPGCGKSFISEEIISAILNNRKVFNKLDVLNGRPIILIDMESDHSVLYRRLTGLGGIPPEKLLVFSFEGNFDMGNPSMTQLLVQYIEKIDPCLVIFDTLRRTYAGDENDSRVMNEIYKTVLQPISKKRCCLIIAHTRKGVKNGSADDELSEIRGTGDITGLASSVIMVKKNEDKTFLFKPLKLRPAEMADPMVLRINVGNKETKDETYQFEVLNDIAIKTEIDVIADKLFEWLKHNKKPMEEIRTKEMKEYLVSEGHNPRNITDGIRLLSNQGWLVKTQKGRYIFKYGDDTVVNFLPDE